MIKKSFSDLSTTLVSVKGSMPCKNNEMDYEQIEISASIISYSIIENPNKLFKKNYVLFELKLYTPYKAWIIHKRYSDFVQLRKKLESNNLKNLPKLPPKILFLNEQKLNERQLILEEFINELFKAVNILKYPLILDFIECPQEVVTIFKYNMDSSIMVNTTNNNSNYYNGTLSTNKKNVYNYDNINNNNLYCSMAQFKLNNNSKSDSENDDPFEEDISPGTLIIQEFLRNLMDISFNKTELLFQFEFFLKNQKNENKNNYKNTNWYYLNIEEIEIFFEGFYSNISNTKINGFLYHCGNIQNNKIGTQKCIEFLKKLLSEDFNPQVDTFLKIFRATKLENIIQMELEKHIIDNSSNSNRINAFIILYKYVGMGKFMENKIKRILMSSKAEKLFMNWFDNQEF